MSREASSVHRLSSFMAMGFAIQCEMSLMSANYRCCKGYHWSVEVELMAMSFKSMPEQ
jgi:hypothetical protein